MSKQEKNNAVGLAEKRYSSLGKDKDENLCGLMMSETQILLPNEDCDYWKYKKMQKKAKEKQSPEISFSLVSSKYSKIPALFQILLAFVIMLTLAIGMSSFVLNVRNRNNDY